MTHRVELFWSFRSPYSYLALSKAIPLTKNYDLEIVARPVYPLAVRVPNFFKRTNPQFAAYVYRDSIRVAEWLGVPFGFPRPDPIAQDMKTLEVAPEQPRIRRLMRLGAAAQEAGRALAFIDEISRVLWGAARSTDGIKATISPKRRSEPGSIWRSSTPQSWLIRTATKRSSPKTSALTPNLDTGAYLRLCSMASRSSGRIVSTCSSGA